MAIGRIVLTKRQYKALTDATRTAARQSAEVRRARNEFVRAHDRPGLLAQIDDKEAAYFLPHCGNMPEVKAKLEELVEFVVATRAEDTRKLAEHRARMSAGHRRSGAHA